MKPESEPDDFLPTSAILLTTSFAKARGSLRHLQRTKLASRESYRKAKLKTSLPDAMASLFFGFKGVVLGGSADVLPGIEFQNRFPRLPSQASKDSASSP